ncbi:MAG: cytochrome P450 [Myxococcota bacterium]
MEAVVASPVAPTPGPRGWPVVGSLVALARDPLAFFTAMPAQYGDVVHYTIGAESVWLVSHPDGIEQVLLELRDVMHKDALTHGLSRLLGNGLLTAEDPLWKRQRKLAAPSFQPRHLAGYAEVMVDAARTQLASISPGIRDVHADLTAATLEIVLRTLFGSDAGPGRSVGAEIDAFMHAFEQEVRSWRRMLPPWVPTAGRRRIRAARATIGDALGSIVAARRASGVDGDDLLGRLLAARDDDGAPMSDEQLADEAVTLFLAGHETTALTLSYAAWLVAHHPEVQAAVVAELDAVLAGAAPTLAHVPQLRWVDAVIQEALRLYPPAWVIGRTPTADVVVQGHPIPRGAQILMAPWVVHRDPRWWREPDRFRPERWLGDETRSLPRFAWFPFGGGPRVCIGNHFAKLEAVLVLATWLQRLALEPVDGATLDLMPAVTLRPRTGVRLSVRPR